MGQKPKKMEKKMNNILALDIDDCILPSNVNYFGNTDDDIQLLEINLKRLVMILDKYDMNVFITSSWYQILNLKDGTISLKDIIAKDKLLYEKEKKVGELLEKYLKGKVIGMSCGNRITDIINLLDGDNIVIALDDMDLSEVVDKNYLFVLMKGFIDGNVGYKISKFFREKEKIK